MKRIDNLAKPIGSLGTLESISAKMAGITGKTKNSIEKKNIIVMCADNGVGPAMTHEEAVAAFFCYLI